MLNQGMDVSVHDHASANTVVENPTKAWYSHSSANRVSTDVVLASTIRAANPDLEVTVIPQVGADLLAYAKATGAASVQPVVDSTDPNSKPLYWRTYVPPAERLGLEPGTVTSLLKFGKFLYIHQGQEYILYVADCRDGTGSFPQFVNQYLLHSEGLESQSAVEALIREAGEWSNTLHGEIWVFDRGRWQKEADLWRSIAKGRWEDVILDESEKKELRTDAKKFYDGRARYEHYGIAWKRGIIYYGPPGNGKTISIKALANELYQRSPPIPTLYVKSFTSPAGPEASIKAIFAKARSEAPCLLVLEDLDSLVTDAVRSYFLNEIDGLNTNSGVYMVGSTNHMDRLDPGIGKRPSRFDRKMLFATPNEEQRTKYCEYWRHKLQNTKGKTTAAVEDLDDMVHVDQEDGVEFPAELSPEIAKITDGFSFAYMQEAFVATLLTIVSGDDKELTAADDAEEWKDKFDYILFWRVMKKQVALLKEQI